MKKFIALLLLLTLVLPLTACHGDREKKAFYIPDEFDTTRNYEISFWAKNDTNITQVNIYKKAIEDFQELYPNITVNLRLYTDYGKIYNDVITNIATNTTPNVCITYPDHIATYLTGEDTVVPLDDLFDDKKYGLGGSEVRFDSPTKEEIIPQFLSECEFNGHYYAIPYMRSTEACYVNKTYVEKLGYTLPDVLTWDFIWEVSEKAVEKDADGNYKLNGQKVMIPFIYKSTDNMMIQVLKQKDAPYSTVKGEVQIFNETTSEFLLNLGDQVEKKSFNTFKLTGYPANFLNAGQCIFAIDSTAGATWMGCKAPLLDIPEEKVVEFETAVMTVPQYDVDNPKMISQGPSMCVFNREDSQEVLASWLFAQFMLTNDVQIAYSQTEGYAPVTSKAQNCDEYVDYLAREGENDEMYYDVKLKATKLLLSNTENTFVTPVFNGSASLRNAAGQLSENVNKTVRRNGPIDESYLEEMYDEVSAMYRLDQINISNEKLTLGELPNGAIWMIAILAICWVCMGFYVVVDKIKKKKR
ncbi:MAG: extracellular solute-binding protein [Clostridia bacterium]|nr:extracellular solute-binding protein [Clostridia bacterium]